MNFLVLGCNGMAGHIISIYLSERGHKVTGYARTQSNFVKTIIGDVTDTKQLEKAIVEGKYDSVINCVGLLNQFAENNHSGAALINSYIPHFLADVTSEMDTQIIHMSTDCVFSGKRGGYTEGDLRDGTSFYDRSKALGEIVDSKNVTLRQSVVGPDIKPSGIGLLNWFMKQDGPVQGYLGAIWTGQTTLQLAKTMERVAEQRAHGLINAVPNESINKYELLKLFNQYIRKNQIEIEAVDKVVADKSLLRTNYEYDLIIPGYKQMISELGDWMRAHRELYPHYDI